MTIPHTPIISCDIYLHFKPGSTWILAYPRASLMATLYTLAPGHNMASPLYIWMLIVTIILASRHLHTIARITPSNTVSVLATLLLLSYSKLLKNAIETFSYIDLVFLNNKTHVQRVWKLDANIAYMGPWHTPLFLIASLTVIVYIIPFTFLMLLGPLLQAKSHHRCLNWVNKMKPFFDAFYGPYTNKYRYWPGILLLTRLLVLVMFGFYSPTDFPYRLMVVSVVVIGLLIVWMLIGGIKSVSLYRRKCLRYVELFFLLNLGFYTAISLYNLYFSTKRLYHQQVNTIVMIGTSVIVFYGIVSYQMFHRIYKTRAVYQRANSLWSKLKQKATKTVQPSNEDIKESVIVRPTQSEIELSDNQIREPLIIESEEQIQ